MRVSTIFRVTLALAASVWGAAAASTQAIQLADGTLVSFKKPPNLIDVTTTYKETSAWGARYYFVLELPENAGEPLERVTINQRQGIEDIRFDLKKTQAFEGTPRHEGEKLTLKEVTIDAETKTVSVTFDPPVMPGKTFTIELRPVRNPDVDGVYLFGVTAFPAAEMPYGLYLGPGRLHFYRDGGDFGFLRFHRRR
jgi:hypothetical protein